MHLLAYNLILGARQRITSVFCLYPMDDRHHSAFGDGLSAYESLSIFHRLCKHTEFIGKYT